MSLQSGVPFPGTVEADSYRYFKFVVENNQQSVSISVTSVAVNVCVCVCGLCFFLKNLVCEVKIFL